ncbi:tetratricopeptide repeat protein [Lutibacter sp. A64]|uniref:tetratricopeptide repeat protein n=1 Tax=Lutibacter sp. A64 TaxID=2918526 RepID=UPI001F056EC2|nr:tetratricopeptide repeat protein [Lutibacter sp. A64]UMB54028.1 tetratricopeptide repeat protein [Lutibacter sp. A64]
MNAKVNSPKLNYLLFKYSILVLSFIFISCNSKKESEYSPLQIALNNHKHDEGFIGSKNCIECHQTEYNEWMGSDHQLAMQLPTDSTVLGDFNNIKYTIYGVTSTFFKKDSLFMVNTQGPDGKYADFEVKYTFGVYPLQQYLVIFPKGSLQVLTPFWDSRSKEDGGQKWQHLYPDEFIASHDELNWGRALQNWNYMCAECHSTNVKKNYNPDTQAYNTTFDEINVSCEACHGPGDLHEKWAKDTLQNVENMGFVFDIMDRDPSRWIIDPETAKVTRSKPRTSNMQVEWCGRCHSRRAQLTDEYIFGKVLEHTHQIAYLDYPLYNDDGTNNDEDYVYGSFLQSKMYAKGVTCKDCHNVHSGELKGGKENVCFQCHMPSKYKTKEHHKHDENGTGASCISCHLPKITIMVVDPRSDHSMRIPRPDISVKTGAVNACNNCHTDKSNEWAAKEFKNWYGNKYDTIPHYGFAFHNIRTNKPDAQSDLNKVINDKDMANIVVGTAIRFQDYNNNPLAFENLKMALASTSPLVRRAGLESLRSLSKQQQYKYALPLANDTVYGVRHMANSLIYDIPTTNLPTKQKQVVDKARKEYINQLLYWQDRSLGLSSIGVAAIGLGKLDQAEDYFKKAVALDTLNLIVKINYADLKRMQGKNEECISLLKEVIEIDKTFSMAYQALAFAYIRIGDKTKAFKTLETAKSVVKNDAQNHYYYAVMQNDLGNSEEAIKTITKALKEYPNNEQLLTLAYSIYKNKGDSTKAENVLNTLIKVFPHSNQYQQVKNLN